MMDRVLDAVALLIVALILFGIAEAVWKIPPNDHKVTNAVTSAAVVVLVAWAALRVAGFIQ